MDRLLAALFAPAVPAEGRLRNTAVELRVPTAAALTEAQAEAELLGNTPLQRNACLLARAVYSGGAPLFPDGTAVLSALTPGEIDRLAQALSEQDKALPGLWTPDEELEDYLSALKEDGLARLRWWVQREFHALPTEKRVRDMTGRDYLYCALNLILDRREALEQLCPDCREKATQPRCACCGKPLDAAQAGENPAFDWARFRALCQEAAR